MRQRVALIRTLAINPQVILLDEPYSALDYQTRKILANDMYTIIKNEQKTAVLITHNIEEAVNMADRVIEQIPAREILLGGGNIHCITQQVPENR